jgi:hypothetical protein
MRAKIGAALCACALVFGFFTGSAEAGGYGYGYAWYGGNCCYRGLFAPSVRYAWVAPPVYGSAPVYYPPFPERYRVVRFSELSYSGIYAYAPDDGCYWQKIPLLWGGGWAWSLRAGCF